MKCPYAAVVFLLMGGTALGGPVTLVATWDFGNSFSTPQVVESARPVLFYLGPNNEIWSPLFEDFSPPREYPANLTETVWTSNDPDFSSFASRLTNGTNDELGVLAWADQGPIGGGGGTESDLLLLVPRLGPDLVGYEINHITEVLTIDLQTPGSDPFGDGVNTDWSVTGRYEFYGAPIPEPTTLSLLVSSALLIIIACQTGTFSRREKL